MSFTENSHVISSRLNGEKIVPTDLTGEWTLQAENKSKVRCVYSYRQVDEIMERARVLHLQNKRMLLQERIAILKRLKDQVIASREVLKAAVDFELGRLDEDFDLEWKQVSRLLETFDTATAGSGRNALASFLASVNAQSLADHSVGEAKGITAYVGSYVWPIFYTLQFFCLNFIAGNTTVIKPSERSTVVVDALMEVIEKVPELKSWLHLLVGEKETGRRLICHEHVNTVIFMGSFEVGMRVKQDTLSQSWKEVLLYLGAKNPAILCEDYPVDALPTLLQDSFSTMGQHCRSASLFFVHQARLEEFQEAFHQEAKKVKVTRLIDPSMVERYLKFSGISEREGAKVEMRGKPLPSGAVTPTISVFRSITPDLIKKSVTLQTEILSPHISIMSYSSYDELLEMTQKLQWGLCASLWTKQESRFQQLARLLPFGQIIWNQSTLEWNPFDSYQAYKKSGNHAYHGLKMLDQLTVLKSIELEK
jgi:succinylglutamic semialdehyde dehydrogenase